MSQLVRENLMEQLWDLTTLHKDEVLKMTDEEVEYYHWLYLEESVYDLM
ncbi:BH0509 family protein [Sediminibacillus dalangtanensis]|uniref:BH0509 family protein n=1 Tax=Sediminibacillus dalangtanensis TaxID=2729421 RepID=A0ABX7VRM6_9BACI|nr:BH0509 family protein [Sediminibacillus dalangtanensis]QTM99576.1 BH0509 family protein [Sediminibacillus dalangtanensis]